jgi:hypothetical protein
MNSRATLNHSTMYDISTKERESSKRLNNVVFKDITITTFYTLLQQQQQLTDTL